MYFNTHFWIGHLKVTNPKNKQTRVNKTKQKIYLKKNSKKSEISLFLSEALLYQAHNWAYYCKGLKFHYTILISLISHLIRYIKMPLIKK